MACLRLEGLLAELDLFVHANGPEEVGGVRHLSPEDVIVGCARFGILRKVIATKGDLARGIGTVAQEDAKGRRKVVFATLAVHVLHLLDERLELARIGGWCKPYDAAELVLLDVICLDNGKELTVTNARFVLVLTEAELVL